MSAAAASADDMPWRERRLTSAWSKRSDEYSSVCCRTRGVPPNPGVCACRWSKTLIDRNFVKIFFCDPVLDFQLSRLIGLFP